MMTAEIITNRLKEHIPSAQIRATDMTGGGDHWQVRIRATEFKGKTLIQQHQMVYQALGELMKSQIHALSLDTGEA
ncbi:MAG: BolA/IbaG family iron-sulfur metabolism protein [Proteobacteria bacterium]|nr:BolA/IbaG family iron-sulfur metabolism protein [Pseudomonadota bacterium]